MSVAAYIAAVNADAPSDFWYLDEASGDPVNHGSSGNTLAASGSIVYQVEGPLGSASGNYAYQFDGVTTFLGGTVLNEFNYSQLTWEAWALPFPQPQTAVLTHDRLDGYGIQLSAGGFPGCWARTTTTQTPHVTAGVSLYDSFWHHIVWRWTGSVLDLYIDGQAYASYSAVGPINIQYGASQQFFVGADAANAFSFFGNMCFLALYNGVALSPARILVHAQALAYALSPPSPPSSGGNLLPILQEILGAVKRVYSNS